MSVKTTYTCDRCRQEIPPKPGGGTPDQFWDVRVTLNSMSSPGAHYAASSVAHATLDGVRVPVRLELCRPCVEALRLLPAWEKRELPPAPPTIEELLVELIDNRLREVSS